MSYPISSLRLVDALERLIATPWTSHGWHRLNWARAGLSPTDTEQMFAVLDQHLPDAGPSGFLKHSFLAQVRGSAQHWRGAALALESIVPVDADRIAAFLLFAWGRLIETQSSHQAFVAALANARFAELGKLAGAVLARQCADLLPARPVTRVERVALIASHMGAIAHTPTCMALDQARVLIACGYQVEIFSAQEQQPPGMPDFLGVEARSMTAEGDAQQWAAYLDVPADTKLQLHRGDVTLSMPQRGLQMMRQLARFDPDLVFFVGLHSPLLTPLYARRPVLALSNHAFAPIAPVDAWLCADQAQAGRPSATWAPALPAPFACPHGFRIRPPAPVAGANRAERGLPHRKVILVSVGARLPREIGGEWAERMRALLAQRADVLWLLVGGDASLPAGFARGPSIMALPHSSEVATLLPLCDIYVNPARVGGGFSVAEAMAAALPVAALAGADGGNKIGALAATDLDDYFAKLMQLIDDAALRAAQGAAMRALFEQTLSLDHSHASLHSAIDTTVALYAARTPA